MNILFVTLYSLELNSSVSISSKSIIRGMLSLGHTVSIIMPYGNQMPLDEDIKALRIIRINGQLKSLSKYYIVNKIHSKLEIYDFKAHGFVKEANRISIPNEYFDLVISVSDPLDSHLFVRRLIHRGLKCGRWIQHWGDPIYKNISHKLIWPSIIIRLYEWFIMKNADKIIYVSPFSANVQKDLHKRMSNKIFFIPLPADNVLEGSIKTDNKLTIVYAGDYNKYIRNIIPLYEACCNQDWINLKIVGTGKPLLPQNNINIIPRVSQREVAAIENNADVLVGICNLRGTQIPGKIFYKSGTNKHILVILEEENKEAMKAYFESYNRFIVCDNNPYLIKEALNKLRNKQNYYSTPERLLAENVVKEILK